MEDCVFCKIVKGELPSYKVWENENYLAFLTISPINPGHTLLIPKKHTDQVVDLSDSEYLDLFSHVKKISAIIKEKLNAKRIGIIVEGFGVAHAHIHLVPINHGGELSLSNVKPATQEELNETFKKING